ncbi:MAG: TetR/AcrR family transcriptional regulator [Geminicoccaceae bacterium]
MGRPRLFDQDAVLRAAMELFWSNGYEGTATDDLEAATGLRRGSLYNAFGDKRRLYLAALDHYTQVEMGEAVDTVSRGDNVRDGVAMMFGRAVDQASLAAGARGCMVCDAAIDLAPEDPEVATRVRRALDRLRRAIAGRLAAERTSDLPDRSADHLVATYMGLKVMAKAGYDGAVLRDVADQAVSQISGAV